MRDIEYRSRNIRETLVELKDSSELAVDLAYSAVLFDSRELAEETLELASQVNYLQYHARLALMLAAKNVSDAEALVGIFQVVDGAAAIAEAAADIARIPLRDFSIPAAFRTLPAVHERFARVEVAEASRLSGRTLGDLEREVSGRIDVIALRRDNEWTFAPGSGDRIAAGTLLFVRGPEEGVEEFHELATGEPYEPPATGDQSQDLERAIETVVELKNVSELAVGLAYSAALFDSDAMAEEVRRLEARSNELREDLETWVVTTPERSDANGEELRGLFHLAVAAEVISDAALDVADVVFRDVELHPVFGKAIRESKEVITSVDVVADSDLAGRTVGAFEREVGAGMTVLARRRADGWTYDPDEGTEIRAGDSLVLRGPRRSEKRVRQLAGEPHGEA